MERFEQLFESWINGNKKHVRQEFEKMSSNEKYSFANWLKDQHSHEWVDRTELFNMVIFIAFQ
jgi:hypothetical protein